MEGDATVSWETFEPEVVKVIGDFLAEVPKSVVLLRLGPDGEILDTNPAFIALFPAGRLNEVSRIQNFLEPCDVWTAGPLPTALVTYRLLGSVIPGSSIRGIHVPIRDGSVLVGERLLPSSTEDLALLTASTNEMARLHREVQRNFRESKRAQSHLESRHKLLVTSTDQGMVHFDREGHVLDANPGALRILGLSHLPSLEAALMDASGEDGIALLPESHPVIHTLRTGQSRLGVLLGLRRGATWILLDAMPEFEAGEDRPKGVCATFNDITERTRGEETLLALTQRLQLATASAKLAVWDWDIRTGTMSWDDRMLEIYGVTRDDLRGNVDDWRKWLHPEDLDRATAECEAAIQGVAPFDTEFRVIRPDGMVHWVKANADVLRDSKGQPRRMIGLNQDITQKKMADEDRLKIQAQLQQSQKMESLGTLAGGVAHDMNNVLGAILGLASAHIGAQPYGSPLHQALDTICKATERGGKMVKSLLSFARQSPAEECELDVNAILHEEVTLLERTTLSKVRLELDLAPDLPTIRGDASALTHAFMNLCVNAVDAMSENGTLTLRTRHVDNSWIEVEVEDNGMGMPKEVLERATEPFFTTKGIGYGTGLGLSMVFSTAKAHRGEMAIESEPGRGTRVKLRFPALEQELVAQVGEPGVDDASPQPRRNLKVLLVDDDDLIQSSLQAILECLGHTAVTTASSGEEALAFCEAGLQADLVILDMNMPGLGGIGTLPHLRRLHPTVPVLLSTGRVDQTGLNLASSHLGVTLLTKPFGVRELQKHLESIGLG